MEETVVKRIVYVIVLCIACYETTTFGACLYPCARCTSDINNTSYACLECDDGYSLLLQNGNYTCVPCPDGCLKCTLHSSFFPKCTSCFGGYFLTEDDKYRTLICERCTENCTTCEIKNICTSCIENHYLTDDDDHNTAVCKNCAPAGCRTCDATGNCLSCSDDHSDFLSDCWSKGTIITLGFGGFAIVVAFLVCIAALCFNYGCTPILPKRLNNWRRRKLKIWRRRISDNRLTAYSTEGMLYMVKRTVKRDDVEPLEDTNPVSINEVQHIINKIETKQEIKGNSGLLVGVSVHTKDGDTKTVSSNEVPHIVQNNKTEQEIKGISGFLVEVSVHTKDEENKPVAKHVVPHNIQKNESEQETREYSGDSVNVTVQNKDDDTKHVSSNVVPHTVQKNENEQEIKGDSGFLVEVTVHNKDEDTKPVSSNELPHIVHKNETEQEIKGNSGFLVEFSEHNKDEDKKTVSSNVVPHIVQNNESEQETAGGSGDLVEATVQNKEGETIEVPIGGSMVYYPEKLLGFGSYGVVYEGRSGVYKNKLVAVKKVMCSSNQDAQELQNINKEIRTMETLDTTSANKHVIRFIDSYINKNTVFLAFELAQGTLVQYISNADWQKLLTGDDVIRGVVAGLNYTHQKNIIHRDLKPGNIFIVGSDLKLKAVIGDFGQAKATTGTTLSSTKNTGSNGYIAPEIWKAISDTETVSLGSKCNKASDIFSLGLVVYYAMSLGNHPFGNNFTAQESISKGNSPTFQHIANHINSFTYEDMLKGMLNNDPDDRLSMEVVSEHPALWTSDKIIQYFVQKSDKFESQIKTGTLNDKLLEDPSLITGGNWMNHFPVNLKTYLLNYRLKPKEPLLYMGKKTIVRYFLRAIRNTTAHYKVDYPANTHAELGTFPDGHVKLWLTVCPKLLMHVYTKLGPP